MAGPNLDKNNIKFSDPAPFYEYKALYWCKALKNESE